MSTAPAPRHVTVRIPDDETLQPTNFKLSARHREWLRVEAFRRRLTRTDVLRELIDRAMTEQEAA